MLPDNKVSSDNDVNVTLVRVNKVRGNSEMLRKTFGDRTTVCCFKLETDHNVSFEKAKKLLEPPTLADAVVMNLLNGRYNTVVLLFPSGNSVTLESKVSVDLLLRTLYQNGDIDEGIVDALLQIHHRRLTGESVTPQ
ncbi:uncharacterized protein BXIN_0484 [Babesia sp. Xinjiang]|uniref:uncharacterized protein n=1 Tax=Babesia sp. Xinjiang TaxID=462227 RepID=UPI000A252F8F|nr:uncharacterized protein BXIN_0484 [Babesia sp. Xinjiang]ORM41931.1 hypothetical protein BXIN_0484 [Babesia sp. Xinjiang]